MGLVLRGRLRRDTWLYKNRGLWRAAICCGLYSRLLYVCLFYRFRAHRSGGELSRQPRCRSLGLLHLVFGRSTSCVILLFMRIRVKQIPVAQWCPVVLCLGRVPLLKSPNPKKGMSFFPMATGHLRDFCFSALVDFCDSSRREA